MQSKKSMLVLLAAAFMLVAGSAFGQSIFVNSAQDLNISPEMTLAQAGTAKAAPAAHAKKELSPEEQAKREEAKKNLKYFGGFGGAGASYLPLNMDPFKPLTEDRDIDNFGPLWTIGGRGGVIYKGFRFGGYGFGVSQGTEDEVAGDHRKAVIDMGGGGIFMELNTTGSRKAGLFIGSDIGAGSIALHAKGDDLGPEGKFDADRAVFFAYPYLGFWLAPTDWMWVRVDGGWNYFHINTTANEFENDLGIHMVDGPIKGNYQVGLNLCFGYIPKGE